MLQLNRNTKRQLERHQQPSQSTRTHTNQNPRLTPHPGTSQLQPNLPATRNATEGPHSPQKRTSRENHWMMAAADQEVTVPSKSGASINLVGRSVTIGSFRPSTLIHPLGP